MNRCWGILKGSAKGLLRVLLIIACAFFINTLVLLATGKSPTVIYAALFKGAFGDLYNFARSVRWATPLIFTALSFAIAARNGIFNVGAEGQLYMGAFAAAWVGFTFTGLPRFVLLPLCILAAMAAGMLWSMLAGWLMLKFHSSIVVITLMLNYIAILFTEYLVRYPFYVEGTLGESGSTNFIADQAKLTTLIPKTNVTTGIIIAVLAAVFVFWWNSKTVIGYENKLIGGNELFARFSGIDVKKRQMLAMAIAGMLAGLGGAVEILGNYGRFMVKFASNLGFDGIVVSLLAGNNPLLVPVSALFMGSMTSGSISVEMFGGVPKAMTGILLGIIIMIITVKKLPELARRRKKVGSQSA